MIKIHCIPLKLSQSYTVESDSGLVLVDTGMPGQENIILKSIKELKKDLKLIFITHAHIDHYGSAEALRTKTGTPIAIHKSDANNMELGITEIGSKRGRGRFFGKILPLVERHFKPVPTKPDILVKDGFNVQKYGVDGIIIHTPGHTKGSSSLIIKNRIAFVGDLLDTKRKPFLQNLYAIDWSILKKSLIRLRKMKLDKVYGGHGHKPLSGKEFRALIDAHINK